MLLSFFILESVRRYLVFFFAFESPKCPISNYLREFYLHLGFLKLILLLKPYNKTQQILPRHFKIKWHTFSTRVVILYN